MIDPATFRSSLGRFATGVTVVTARDRRGVDHGMTVSAFCSLSLEPPLVLACVGEDASLSPILGEVEQIGISILSSDQEDMSRRFADREETTRFEGVAFTRGENGVALLDEALTHLECRVVRRHREGDHTILVAEVNRATTFPGRPLIYFRGGYGQLER